MRPSIRIAPACLVLLVLAAGCAGPAGPDPQELRAAVKECNDAFMEAFAQRDAAAIAALYAQDAQLLPPGAEFVVGRPAIEDFWQGAMDSGILLVELESREVSGSGEMAYEVGRYKLSLAGGVVADEGKYLVLFRRIEGEWKLFRDIWNSSRQTIAM